MGVCSYCYLPTNEECFGWPEAKACAGISGPDDPKRLEAKARFDRDSEAIQARARTKSRLRDMGLASY